LVNADCSSDSLIPAAGFPTIVLRNFIDALAAIILNNLIYFLVLAPLLPPAGRHEVFRVDWGLVIDFWVCVALYGVIQLLLRRKRGRASGG
jgi:hypothetical protein